MRAVLIAALLLLCACRGQDAALPAANGTTGQQEPAIASASGTAWDLQSSGEGAALVLQTPSGAPVLRLFCPAGRNQLLVNVRSFQPIGSEERLSVGSGGTVVALVADPRGDPQRGGVTGVGPVPEEIKAIVTGAISVSYGAQTSGPHPRAPDTVTAPFVSACYGNLTAARVAAAKPTASTHPCNVQGDRLLTMSMRALGTEPFWNARIQGRCVTYSHPENQAGTRLWTQVNDGPDGPVFAGAYRGRPFHLSLSPAVNCSDGMSDNRYDWEARLTVEGEERRGCAEVVPTGR